MKKRKKGERMEKGCRSMKEENEGRIYEERKLKSGED
jgi:hypothetical protein